MPKYKLKVDWEVYNEKDDNKPCAIKIDKLDMDFSTHGFFHLLEALVQEEPELKEIFVNFAKSLVTHDLLDEIGEELMEEKLKEKGKYEN